MISPVVALLMVTSARGHGRPGGRGGDQEVASTIENPDGEFGSVSAVGADHGSTLSAARELVSEGCKAIVLRTTDYSHSGPHFE